MIKRLVICCVLSLLAATHAAALTLSEYGISLTSTGLVDNVSGLRWLDSSLTDGNLDNLQDSLDAGWRIASQQEFYFLVSRQTSEFGGTSVSELGVDGLAQVADRLSFVLNQEYSGPWVCRAYGDPEQYCGSTTSFGGRFILNAHPLPGDLTQLQMFVYLSEVPMYGDLFCDYMDCLYEGRSLMVRAVPLPSAWPLFLLGITVLTFMRQRATLLNSALASD